MTKKATKRALLSSALALVVCISMLIGTTYAWFTDSVTSTNNIIKSGNLDVELYYQVEGQTDWTKVTDTTNVFKENALWEPGHTEVVKLKVVNEGTLALKYQLGVNIASEVGSVNVAGEAFKLSDYIKYAVIDGEQNYTRDTAVAAAEAKNATALKSAYNSNSFLLAAAQNGQESADIFTMVVYMPTTVGNEANYRGNAVPTINLGINLFATQFTAESDSFGTDYDAEAPAIEVANTAELQAALDNATLGTTIKLLPNVAYDAVVFRPTAANVSEMVCNSHPEKTYTDAEEFKAHMNDGQFHHVPYYTTELLNTKIIGAEKATIAGFNINSSAGTTHDYVLDADRHIVSYLNISNLTFENVAFIGRVNITSSLAESSIQGVTFDGCSFTTGGTDDTNGQAIRYYNENNDGQVKNLVVKNCTFYNCRHGVYVQNVNTVTVTDNVFDTTGHNAIALQGSDVNLKDVVIARNTFKNIGDRIIRFNTVGADSNITIQDNVATNSGDADGEVIKANSIAPGVTTSVKNNLWGAGKIVANEELKDVNSGATTIKVSNNDALNIAIDNGATNIELAAGNYNVKGNSNVVINGSGKDTVIKFGNSIENANISNVTIEGEPRLAVKSGQAVKFENVNFEGTKAWGSVQGGAEFKGCTFTGLFHIDSSAATSTITFDDCTFDEYSIIKLGGSAKYILNNCVVEKLAADATGAWGKEWLITYCDTTFTNCKLGRVIRAGATINIALNNCVDGEGNDVTKAIVHKNASPNVSIDGYEFITSATVSKPVAPLEEDFLFPAGTNAVLYKNVIMSDDAQIVHTENVALGLSNVVAELDHDVIIRKSAGAIVIEDSEFTLIDGAKLIRVGEGGDAYQVFLVNVKVNGVLLTNANAGQYLEGINWFQAVPEWPNM